MSKKVCVIGHFAFGKQTHNGQTVKTKIVADELIRRYGREQVTLIDTSKRWQTLLTCKRILKKALREHENVVILPAQNGLRIIAPLLSRMKKQYPHAHLHDVVVGGWLPIFLQSRQKLAKALATFDGVYVETSIVKKALCDMGFDNIFVMPNCKPLQHSHPLPKKTSHGEPYRLCTLSRVMREKGIEEAVEAVRVVNDTLGREVFTLSIFGQVDKTQRGWFDALNEKFPPCVTYGGVLPYDACRDTLAGYDALLFPTQYKTEGIPGCIIDGYGAGLPVLATRWEGFSDMVDEGVTGLGFDMGADTTQQLTEVLLSLANNPQALHTMGQNALIRAERYEPSFVLQILCDQM